MNSAIALACGMALAGSSYALAAEGTTDDARPDEGAMFGTPEKEKAPALKKTSSEKSGDSFVPTQDAFKSGEITDNPLQIGGVYYQQMIVSPQTGNSLSGVPASFPLQFDGFLDARPNDRLRGFLLGRLFFDASRTPNNQSTAPNAAYLPPTASTSSGSTSLSSPNPQVLLDQAWLKFDMARTVFATVGKQHVKWGTGHFWNPTDFLHAQRRDALLPYDPRSGASMVKLELPVDVLKTNLYAMSLVDNPIPASTQGQLGQAFRIEKVLGTSEIGIEAVYRGGTAPVYGGDFSFPLGPFDVYGEAAALGFAQLYQLNGPIGTGTDLSTIASALNPQGPFAQVTLGLNYQFAWADNRQATIGFEYFYNQAGYDNSAIYPALMALGQFQSFYLGRNYAGLYLTFEGPDAEKRTSYTLSTLGNFSDMSFITRLDFAWRVLTYLTFGAYVDGHYGNQGGEFNLSFPYTASYDLQTSTGTTNLPFNSIAGTLVDVGLSLRVGF